MSKTKVILFIFHTPSSLKQAQKPINWASFLGNDHQKIKSESGKIKKKLKKLSAEFWIKRMFCTWSERGEKQSACAKSSQPISSLFNLLSKINTRVMVFHCRILRFSHLRLHLLFHFTKSHIESSSTGSSFPAVLAKSVPFAAGSLQRWLGQ